MKAKLATCILLFCTCTHGAFAQFSCAELTAPDWEARWHKIVADYYKNGGSGGESIQDFAAKITNQQKVCFDIEETKARIAHEQQQVAQNTTNSLGFDGKWWVSASSSERAELLIGLVKGVKVALETICVRPFTAGKTLDQHTYDACIEKFRKESPVLDANNDKLFTGVDSFYKDADNRRLDVEYAFMYVKGEENGLPIKFLNEELAHWRNEAH